MMNLFYILLASMMFASPVFASDPIEGLKQEYNEELVENPSATTADFKSIDWTEGIHLIGGLGLNFASYESDIRSERIGLGSNFRSDVGYYFENGLGLELSGSVMFNRVPQGLIWNSAFMVGVRFAVPPVIAIENIVPYMRIFAGRSTGVISFDGKPEAPFDTAQRIQLEGTVTGFGLGHLQRAENGRVWYVEFTVERHAHHKIEAIVEDNGVPVVIGGSTDAHHGILYAFCLTFGTIAF